MSTHGRSSPASHGGGGWVRSRATHAPAGFDPAVRGVSFSEARDGQQVQGPDLAPESVTTEKFNPDAKAPKLNNNPSDPVNASVYVDEDGLHVDDGALFLTDALGTSLLTAAGFGGPWNDFLQTGVYNGRWSAVNQTSDSTLVNSAATLADYLASLSAFVPYWIVHDEGNLPLEFSPGTDRVDIGWENFGAGELRSLSLIQDVPVFPGLVYGITLEEQSEWVDFTPTRTIAYQFRDATHGAIGTETTLDSRSSASDASVVLTRGVTTEAPATARYLRLRITVTGSPNIATRSEGHYYLHYVEARPVQFIAHPASGYRVRKTTAQAIPTSTWTKLTSFNNSDVIRTDTGLVSWNPYGGSEIRVNRAGVYRVTYMVRHASNAGGARRFAGVCIANGATPGSPQTPQVDHSTTQFIGGSTGEVYIHGSFEWDCNANDTFALYAWQDSGGNNNIEYGALSVVYIGD